MLPSWLLTFLLGLSLSFAADAYAAVAAIGSLPLHYHSFSVFRPSEQMEPGTATTVSLYRALPDTLKAAAILIFCGTANQRCRPQQGYSASRS